MSKSNPIKWQQVIEISQATSREVREEISRALAKVENSATGQKLFQEMLDLRNLKGIGPYSMPEILAHGERNYPKGPVFDLAKTISAGRKDIEKVVIYAESAQPENLTPLARQMSRQSAFVYDSITDIAFVDMQKLKDTKLPFLRKGKKVAEVAPLDEVLAHELQHVVDARRTIRDKKKMTLPCGEERAVATENAYRAEKRHDGVRRYAYTDTSADFAKLLEKNPEIASSVRSFNNTPHIQASKIIAFKTVAEGVILNSGCASLSRQEMIKQTTQILNANGVVVDVNAIPPHFIPVIPGQPEIRSR